MAVFTRQLSQCFDAGLFVKMFFHGVHGFHTAHVFQQPYVKPIRLAVLDIGRMSWVCYFINPVRQLPKKMVHNHHQTDNSAVFFLRLRTLRTHSFHFFMQILLYAKFLSLILTQQEKSCMQFYCFSAKSFYSLPL